MMPKVIMEVIMFMPDQTGPCHRSQQPSSAPLLHPGDSPCKGSHYKPYLETRREQLHVKFCFQGLSDKIMYNMEPSYLAMK